MTGEPVNAPKAGSLISVVVPQVFPPSIKTALSSALPVGSEQDSPERVLAMMLLRMPTRPWDPATFIVAPLCKEFVLPDMVR